MATKLATSKPASTKPAARAQAVRNPVLTVTRYDNVRALMCAVVLALVMAVGYLVVLYLSQLEPVAEDHVALELIEIPGGFEDGAINETLRMDSPEPPTQDASLTEVEAEQQEMEETLENVIDVADQATSQAPQQYDFNVENTGKIGSAIGTGRRALGSGGGEGQGVPREQRWFVRFSDSGTLDTYARQLDFFKIQLGLLTPGGQLQYVWNLANPTPEQRTVNTGANEKRLYMTWQGGGRKAADLKLFLKAKIDARRGTIFHFYPPETEQQLARLELAYRNRPVEQIRRTYFIVEREKDGYKFVVTRQMYFQ